MKDFDHKLYGLIGFPLGHSFSRNFFNTKFSDENINAEYVNFELPTISLFRDTINANPNLCGLNVTIPYKRQVMPLLDSIDSAAAAIGAVNVIRFIRTDSGVELRGYNSDVVGFTESIRPMLHADCRKALVLGTGGASMAVVHGLRSLGIEPLYVSRTPEKGQLSYSDINAEIMNDHLVIVNTTPLGMHPKVDTCPDLPYHLLTPRHICFDLVYNPTETLFMKNAAAHGAQVKNGLEMLHLQALEAWKIWNE